MADDNPLSDGELCVLVREGDKDAFGALYSRHAPLAFSVARQAVDNHGDAEDVVADAFHAVLGKLRSGEGPDTFFRAYLLQVVRRTAYARNRSAGRTVPTPEEQYPDHPGELEDPALAEFENQAAAKAFRALPQRWQEVLWYLDVEGQKPAAVAPIMGLAPNAVSALAVRARDALRREYLQAHVSEDVPEKCRPCRGKLGAYVRGSLSRGADRKVREHLDECARCTAIVVELGDVRSAMKAVLLPLIIGVVPAAWWLTPAGQTAVLGSLGWATGGAAAGTLVGGAAAGAGAGAGAASSGGTTAGGGLGSGALGIGAGVAAAAVIAVGLVVAPSLVASWQPQPPAQTAPATSRPAPVAPAPVVPAAAPSAPAPTAPPAPADAPAPVVPAPALPAPVLPPPVFRVPFLPPPAPASSVAPATTTAPTPTTTATPTPTTTATPPRSAAPTPTPTRTPTVTLTPVTPGTSLSPGLTAPPSWCPSGWSSVCGLFTPVP